MLSKRIGIDLGTCNSIVFLPGKGAVLNEPSVVAVGIAENKVLAVGQEAKEMTGRTPDTIRVYRPLKDGVIADYHVTQAMIKYFIKKAVGIFSFFKPELLVGVPAGITSTEKRAVVEAGMSAGAKAVYIAKEPILAAIGAGIPINSCSGHMIVDIGGGTSEVAVISLGGIVTSSSLRVGGDKIDRAISNYIKQKHNLAIGEQTSEEIKIKIGTALSSSASNKNLFSKEADDPKNVLRLNRSGSSIDSVNQKNELEKELEIRGRDLISGLPRNFKISSNEIQEAIHDRLDEIVQIIKAVLRDTPPELSADIMDKGMVVSGGGGMLRNIDELISRATGVPCFLADESLLCVAKGTGVVLENLNAYKKSIMTKK